jgi:glycosyltransferase involved in cell wall biosynthesis
MVVFSHYPQDPRVRREAEALNEAGFSVEVMCLRDQNQEPFETVDAVSVHRLPLQRRRGGKLRYLWEYLAFIVMAFSRLSALHPRHRYQVVHVHNMPDILVASAIIPRLWGAKIILDLHDPMPEAYMAKYHLPDAHPVIRTLRFLERLSIRLAHLVLTPNISFRNLFISRGCPPEKIEVIMNSPQERFFSLDASEPLPRTRVKREGFVLMYHGTIIERYGLGKALEAIASVRDRIPGLVLQVYGDGDSVESFLKRVTELDMDDIVHYHGRAAPEVIAAAIKSADVGLIPNEHSLHWDLAVPTRLFEYLSLGKPAIVPRTRGILDYFDEQSVCYFESGNAQSLAQAILDAYLQPERMQAVLARGMAINQQYRWKLQAEKLIGLVTGLIGRDAESGTELRATD